VAEHEADATCSPAPTLRPKSWSETTKPSSALIRWRRLIGRCRLVARESFDKSFNVDDAAIASALPLKRARASYPTTLPLTRSTIAW
jgi:hypothetical protein